MLFHPYPYSFLLVHSTSMYLCICHINLIKLWWLLWVNESRYLTVKFFYYSFMKFFINNLNWNSYDFWTIYSKFAFCMLLKAMFFKLYRLHSCYYNTGINNNGECCLRLKCWNVGCWIQIVKQGSEGITVRVDGVDSNALPSLFIGYSSLFHSWRTKMPS